MKCLHDILMWFLDSVLQTSILLGNMKPVNASKLQNKLLLGENVGCDAESRN